MAGDNENGTETFTNTDWMPAASRFRRAPGVPQYWNRPHRDPSELPGFKEVPIDVLGIGWRWSYAYGHGPDDPAVVNGFMEPHPPGALMWRDLDGDMAGWTMSIGFLLEDGQPRERFVTFYNDGSATQVSRVQRELRISEALRGLQNLAESMPGLFVEWKSFNTGRTGRRGTKPVHYAEWARRRVEAEKMWADGEIHGSVLAWMAKRYNAKSVDAVKQKMQKARDKKYLDKGNKELTDVAKRLLASSDALAAGGM